MKLPASYRTTIMGASSIAMSIAIILGSLVGATPTINTQTGQVEMSAPSEEQGGGVNMVGVVTGLGALATGIGLCFARDDKVTSKQAEAPAEPGVIDDKIPRQSPTTPRDKW